MTLTGPCEIPHCVIHSKTSEGTDVLYSEVIQYTDVFLYGTKPS